MRIGLCFAANEIKWATRLQLKPLQQGAKFAWHFFHC